MNDTLEIPDSIRKAAIALEIFFKVNGINEWALMGIQSRRSEPTPKETHNKCPECGGELWMDEASVLERKLAAERATHEQAKQQIMMDTECKPAGHDAAGKVLLTKEEWGEAQRDKALRLSILDLFAQ